MDHPPPDTKNWSWVLTRPCPQCGYDATSTDPTDTPALVRANAASWRVALSRGEIVDRRPPVSPGQPPVWSAVEYGAHTRDVYAVSTKRLIQMLKKKAPTFHDWDQGQAAIDDGYAQSDRNRVSYDLASAAGKMADLLDKVRGEQWQRTGTRSDGTEFTVAGYALYILHDVTHHLWDVEQGFQSIADADADANESGTPPIAEDEPSSDGSPRP